jgi:hypothetical protein
MGRSKERHIERDRSRSWYRGDSSRGGNREGRDMSLPPDRSTPPPDERRALRELWQCKDASTQEGLGMSETAQRVEQIMLTQQMPMDSDAIVIIPTEDVISNSVVAQPDHTTYKSLPNSDALLITPSVTYLCKQSQTTTLANRGHHSSHLDSIISAKTKKKLGESQMRPEVSGCPQQTQSHHMHVSATHSQQDNNTAQKVQDQ